MEAFIRTFLTNTGIKKHYIETLLTPKSLSYFRTAFTDPSYDEQNNYLFLREVGKLSYDCSLVWYFFDKFPNLSDSKLTLLKNKTTSEHFMGVYMKSVGMGEFIRRNPDLALDDKTYQIVFEAILGAIEFLSNENYKFGIGNMLVDKICAHYLDKIKFDESVLVDFKTKLKERYFDLYKSTNSLETSYDLYTKINVVLYDVYKELQCAKCRNVATEYCQNQFGSFELCLNCAIGFPIRMPMTREYKLSRLVYNVSRLYNLMWENQYGYNDGKLMAKVKNYQVWVKIGEAEEEDKKNAEKNASEKAYKLLKDKGLIKEKREIVQQTRMMYKAHGEKFASFIVNLVKRVSFLTDLKLDQQDMDIFSMAFTHKDVDTNNYELLETLGDNTMNKCTIWYISDVFPELNVPEGINIANRLKIFLIQTESYGRFAKELGFMDHIYCSEKTINILEDVFESFFAALKIVVDKKFKKGMGYIACYRFLETILNKESLSLSYDTLVDPITQLKETVDKYKWLFKIEYVEDRTRLVQTNVKRGCGCLNRHPSNIHEYIETVFKRTYPIKASIHYVNIRLHSITVKPVELSKLVDFYSGYILKIGEIELTIVSYNPATYTFYVKENLPAFLQRFTWDNVQKQRLASPDISIQFPVLKDTTQKEVAKKAIEFYRSKGISKMIPKEFLKFCI